MSEDRGGRFLTQMAKGRRSLLELVSLDDDELDELLLLRDLDLHTTNEVSELEDWFGGGVEHLDGDRLDVLPDGEGDRLPDLDFAFFLLFVLVSDVRLSLLSEGVVLLVDVLYPVSF